MKRLRYADLSIRLKLLAPFMVLMIVWGGFGSYVLARGAAGEARGRATATLATSLQAARAAVSDAERGLLETVRLAAHTQGMAAALRDRDRQTLRRLLLPIVANARELHVDVVTRTGAIVQGVSIEDGAPAFVQRGSLAVTPVLRAARGAADEHGDKWVGVVQDELTVAGPVRDRRGRAIGAVAVSRALRGVLERVPAEDGTSAALFSGDGFTLAAAGAAPLPHVEAADGVRTTVTAGGESHELLAGPLEARGERIGTVVVGMPTRVAMGSATRTGRLLALLVGLAVLAAVAIGWWTARAITRPLGTLLAATRALERGRLDERADVDANDEVGTLAASFNRMAAELQASHSELEAKVAVRTAELEQANEALARASDAKSRFLASMSHELRTPLNAIIGFADMLGDPTFGPVRAGETRELAGNILTSGRHLLTLINDVLDLAKIEAGRIDVEPEPTDLAAVMGEVLAVVSPLAEQKRHQLSMAGTTMPRAMADPARTRQILFNLVANAIKYTPSGGRITVAVAETAGEVQISVRDTGPGLTPREAKQVFEPFERGKATRATEGAGLGLALAKHLVELQGGRIWASGTPGKGATFTFTLPLVRESQPKVMADA